MLLYLSLSGVLLSVLLIYYNARKYKASVYLGLFFLLVSFYSFHHYIFIYTKSAFWVGVLYVNTTSVFYLTGPMCYFYIRSVITDDARLRWRDCWHFLPAVLHFSAAMAYVVKPWAYKMEIAHAIVENVSFMATHKVNYFAQLLGSVRPIYLSRPLMAFAYAIWSLVVFVKYRKRQKKNHVPDSHQQRIMKKWLKLFLFFQFLLFFSFASLILVRWPVNPVPPFLNFRDLETIVAISLIGLLVIPFLFPQILYGLPNLRTSYLPEESTMSSKQEVSLITEMEVYPKESANEVAVTAEKLEEVEEEKSPQLQLESDYLTALGERIEHCMQEQQPFLIQGFNLLKLAQVLDLPAHHLGYYFREVKQQTFNDYRNEQRVLFAIRLIDEGKADDLTLEAIGNQSGFSSRSAFLKAFKKVSGDTPGNYVESRRVKNFP